MTIGQYVFDDSKQEEWFNSWQDMTNKIGHKLSDSNWESKYSLCHTKDGSEKTINKHTLIEIIVTLETGI